MDALRITLEGAVTSFRYPHFVQGVQPTYRMPPPSTLYGHVCSALGETVELSAFRAAVHFTYSARFEDYEHTHFIRYGEAQLKPLTRELLFQPRLVLYLDRPDWLPQFRTPRYVVTLGRSQDLMRYSAVEVITLIMAERAYAEHTLLPLDSAGALHNLTAQTMPRHLDATRTAAWGQYALLGAPQAHPAPTWADPTAPPWRGLPRAVFWFGFT